jgi:hypothetical protein
MLPARSLDTMSGDSNKHHLTALSPGPTVYSALLDLSQKIRDRIYDLALGSDYIYLWHRGILIAIADSASLRIEDPNIYLKNWTPVRGLPIWMRSSKQICSEALDVIARTRTFRAKRWMWEVARSPAMPLNKLVFYQDGLQNILIRPRFLNEFDHELGDSYAIRENYDDPTDAFMILARRLGTANMCLELDWAINWDSRYTYRPEDDWLRGERDALTEPWDATWYGRFRSTKIVVANVCYPPTKELLLKMLQLAEEYAKKLVGDGGRIIEQQPTTDNDPRSYFSETSVLVQRKI